MTWGEFRDYVEKELREKGVNPDTTEIWYIDVTGHQGLNRDEIRVVKSECGVTIV